MGPKAPCVSAAALFEHFPFNGLGAVVRLEAKSCGEFHAKSVCALMGGE